MIPDSSLFVKFNRSTPLNMSNLENHSKDEKILVFLASSFALLIIVSSVSLLEK